MKPLSQIQQELAAGQFEFSRHAFRRVVEANRELAVRFEQKLQTQLAAIWGAPQTEK